MSLSAGNSQVFVLLSCLIDPMHFFAIFFLKKYTDKREVGMKYGKTCNFYTASAPIFSLFKKVTAIILIITLKMTMMTVFEPLLRRSQIIAQTL